MDHRVVRWLKDKPINHNKLEKLAGIPEGTCHALIKRNPKRSKHFIVLEEYFQKEMKY